MHVTRATLARLLADEVDGLSVQMAAATVDGFVVLLTEILAAEGSLTLAHLGSFRVKLRGERQTYHPKTGAPVTIPAAKVVSFQPSPSLKARLNSPEINPDE